MGRAEGAPAEGPGDPDEGRGDDGSDELDALVHAVRTHPGLAAKAAIGLVSEVLGPSDWAAGPGDDGAVVPVGPGAPGGDGQGGRVVACGEALWPPFVERDPAGAGFAAVLTNVNDLAAMGAEPVGIVDTVVGPDALARSVLGGIREACALYGVEVLGGHLTRYDGPPAVSAFGVGRVDEPLSVTRAAPGQHLVVAAATGGRMRTDFPFFPAFAERGHRCAGDVRLPARLARDGAVVAAKDVSMAGLVGSLAMLLEWDRLGVEVDLDVLPAPHDVATDAWLTCFPSFAFLFCVPPGRQAEVVTAARERGLDAAEVGRLDASGLLRLRRGRAVATAIDLGRDTVTGLARRP